jgi:glycerophosphoryl diester phosphodiesterase
MGTPLISAHRFGAGRRVDLEHARATLDEALVVGVELVEMDVRRTSDGLFVLGHDPDLVADGESHPIRELTGELWRELHPYGLTYADALGLLGDYVIAHVDMKIAEPAHQVEALRAALAVLPPRRIVVTTGSEEAARALREWSGVRGLDLMIGLSLGRTVAGLPLRRQLEIRLGELFPGRRYVRSRANLVVANHWLARISVARFARRRRLPLLVWTVDDRRSLGYWLRRKDVWAVTTNEPALAALIRAELAAG